MGGAVATAAGGGGGEGGGPPPPGGGGGGGRACPTRGGPPARAPLPSWFPAPPPPSRPPPPTWSPACGADGSARVRAPADHWRARRVRVPADGAMLGMLVAVRRRPLQYHRSTTEGGASRWVGQ